MQSRSSLSNWSISESDTAPVNQSPQTEAIAGEYIVFAEFFAIEE